MLTLILLAVLYLYTRPSVYDIKDGVVLNWNWRGERKEKIIKFKER
tara:strand:+ start:69630 stop:69767 length:138 start_codon:yes stop_codon:yes gene_type:complete